MVGVVIAGIQKEFKRSCSLVDFESADALVQSIAYYRSIVNLLSWDKLGKLAFFLQYLV